MDCAVFSSIKSNILPSAKETRASKVKDIKYNFIKKLALLNEQNSLSRKNRVVEFYKNKRNKDKELVDEIYRNDKITYDGRSVSFTSVEGVQTEIESVEKDQVKQIINALPASFRKQARRVHGQSWRTLTESGLKSLIHNNQNSYSNIQLATLDKEGIRAAALAATLEARVSDGYSYSESPGRPQHDFRWQCKQLRIKQRETMALIEIAAGLVGGNYLQSKFSGICSQERREDERARTQEWINNSSLSIPVIKTVNGMAVTEYLSIPLSECGNTKNKSLAEYYGFMQAIKELADLENRKWALVTVTCPAEMHPNSEHYNGHTTPREGNRFLSETKKKVNDTLLNWGCKMAGGAVREPHKSGTTHLHIAASFDCKEKAV